MGRSWAVLARMLCAAVMIAGPSSSSGRLVSEACAHQNNRDRLTYAASELALSRLDLPTLQDVAHTAAVFPGSPRSFERGLETGVRTMGSGQGSVPAHQLYHCAKQRCQASIEVLLQYMPNVSSGFR